MEMFIVGFLTGIVVFTGVLLVRCAIWYEMKHPEDDYWHRIARPETVPEDLDSSPADNLNNSLSDSLIGSLTDAKTTSATRPQGSLASSITLDDLWGSPDLMTESGALTKTRDNGGDR